MKLVAFLTVLVVSISLPTLTHAHGRMMDPVSRMSAYILGFPTPVNYNDHEMNCGGRVIQWQQNGGLCGICGDPWSGPRRYERPDGSLVQGDVVITKSYLEGELIDISLQITANHLGWNEFRICDISKSGGVEATQDCLNENLLTDTTGKYRFYLESSSVGFYNYRLVLPVGFTCSHCLLQWKWHCGNDWGCDETGCGLGKGQVQEEFYACSDVTVLPANGSLPVYTTLPVPTSDTTTVLKRSTTAPVTNQPTTPYVTNQPTTNAPAPASTSTFITARPDTTQPPTVPTAKAGTPQPPVQNIPLYLKNLYNINKNNTIIDNRTKISFTAPSADFVNMLLGNPNNYNALGTTKPPTVGVLPPRILYPSQSPSPPTTSLARDRLCAYCYFGCLVNLCTVSCPEICPAKSIVNTPK